MLIFCAFEQQFELIQEAKKWGFDHYINLVFRKNFSAQVLKANMRVVGNCEYGLIFYRDKLPKFRNEGKMVFNCMDWVRDTQTPKLHPTQKPVPLLENLIRLFTDVDDVVIDPVAGSGTTLLAAKNLGRKAYGFEIVKEFCDGFYNKILPCASEDIFCAAQLNKKEEAKFNGFLSESVYDSAKEAAEAYFDEQINSGNYEECEFKSYSLKKELAKNEISALNLGAIQSSDVIYGERGKVNFLYGSEVFSNSIYIIQTAEGYHYYTLEPKDEEAVCYDFYEHLVNESALNNVTVITKAMIVSEQSGYSRQTEVEIKYCYSGIYIKYDAVLRRFFNGGISETVFSGYIIYSEGEYVIYGINDKGQYVDITQENTMLFVNSNKNDAYMVNVMSQMYKKGHNMFKVDESRYVLRQVEEQTLAKVFENVYFTEEGGEVKSIAYSLTAANQKIESASMNIHAINEDESQELYISIESSFSMYGETDVSVPEEVKNLWANR